MLPPDLIINLHKEIDALKAENAELKRQLAEREGRIETRFAWLIDQISARFPGSIDHLSSRPSELAALEAIDELKRQLAEREGWKIVPKKPTPRMHIEGECVMHLGPRIVYKAMIAAAPNQEEK